MLNQQNAIRNKSFGKSKTHQRKFSEKGTKNQIKKRIGQNNS